MCLARGAALWACEPWTEGRGARTQPDTCLKCPLSSPCLTTRCELTYRSSPHFTAGEAKELQRGPGACPTPYTPPARGRHRTQTRGSSEPGSRALRRKHWSPEPQPSPGRREVAPGRDWPHEPWSLPAPSTVVGLTGFHFRQPTPGFLSPLLPPQLKENIPGRQREADTSESTSCSVQVGPPVRTRPQDHHCNHPRSLADMEQAE